jgi:hypothetical protein
LSFSLLESAGGRWEREAREVHAPLWVEALNAAEQREQRYLEQVLDGLVRPSVLVREPASA